VKLAVTITRPNGHVVRTQWQPDTRTIGEAVRDCFPTVAGMASYETISHSGTLTLAQVALRLPTL
jgi:hypothetical protein